MINIPSDILKENKNIFIKSCYKLIENEGVCDCDNYVPCYECPGDFLSKKCVGEWRSNSSCRGIDLKLVERAKEFLALYEDPQLELEF